MERINQLWMLALILLSLMACTDDSDTRPYPPPQPYILSIPQYFPNIMQIPADNPLTVEGVELGRTLFYDGRLSGRTEQDSLMSCGSCHIQQYNFRPGPDHPLFGNGTPYGIRGMHTKHGVLPLVNLVWNPSGYTWNGAVAHNTPGGSIEHIVKATLTHPAELAGDTAQIIALISSIEGYPDMFGKAFGTPVVTIHRIAKAIAQFTRTLVSANSRFDKYLRGEIQLTTEELEGFILFTTEEGADCFHCHGGSGNPLFTTHLFYNNGKDTQFSKDDDRYSITGDQSDIGAYKATTLRNIAVGGPYMHDARFKTLGEVIDFYAHGVKTSEYINPLMHHAANGGVQLTPAEKKSLVAFLQTLTDEEFLHNPVYGPPATLPGAAIMTGKKAKSKPLNK